MYLTADNIRNVRSREGTYPSPVHLSAWLQDTARLQADGDADFLAIPHAAIKADFRMVDLDMRNVAPAARHAGADIKGGKLSAWGALEYAPKRNELALSEVRVNGADVTYVKSRPRPITMACLLYTSDAADE